MIRTTSLNSTPLKLKVFQASPLAYGNIPIPFLNLDEEEDILKEALQGSSSIDVTFEIATAHGLSTFLAQGKSFLHLSCHGHPSQLFVEDGYGGCHILETGENLRRWITAGGQQLQFVFVSACHSRSAGEAFLEAGVPNVICCQEDGYQLLDQAARVFARGFYTAVSQGTSIQQAYELAKNEVIQSPEIRRVAGINPEVEARKFVLLTGNGDSNMQQDQQPQPTKNLDSTQEDDKKIVRDYSEISALFQRRSIYLNQRLSLYDKRRKISSSNNMSMSIIPVPPQPFLERELDMYRILKALFIDRQKARLIRITGERGIGKISLAKALAHYVKKRNMWGEILWLPPLLVMKSSSSSQTDNNSPLSDSICQAILENYYEKKALLFIDAKQFSSNSKDALCTFLDNVFERTKYLKVILIQDDSTRIESNKIRFSCFEATFKLCPLSFESSAFLFCHACSHLRNWYAAMNKLLRCKQGETAVDETVWTVLGKGNPARILLMAKSITKAEFQTLIQNNNGTAAVQIKNFEQRLKDVNEKMSATPHRHHPNQSSSGTMELKNIVVKEDPSATQQSTKPRPLRTQEEIIDRFAPILRNEGKIYQKTSRAFIRKARKGEHIVTIINGVHATENTVDDDNSWIVCGQVANEYYPLSDEKFKAFYDTEHPEVITSNPFFHANGFKAYRSTRKVFAHKVDETDMTFFRHGDKTTTITKEAYFMAPWETPVRVEHGDYIVLEYPNGEDDIYRIECTLFERSYADVTSTEQQASVVTAVDLRARTVALEESMAQFREENTDFSELEGDIRRHLQALTVALEQAEQRGQERDEPSLCD